MALVKRRTRERARAKLSKRWYALRYVEAQHRFVMSPHRFNVVPAGRRSGKTERVKRKLARKALAAWRLAHGFTGRFFAGAPTRAQAKRIFWNDLKELTAPWWRRAPSESELTIFLPFAEIVVLGLDAPQRIEGAPWDGGVLDEYADMKPNVWSDHVRPALADRRGWCDFTGVPEGRNHYYDLAQKAQAQMMEEGARSDWGFFTWFSSEVLPPDEIEANRRDLDTLVFQQEFEASFVNFTGRAYYAFTDANKAPVRRLYRPDQPLVLCYDFNVAPGVAAIVQEVIVPDGLHRATAVIGEVWIPNNSNTEAVNRKIVEDWKAHEGRVMVYGDASGGARRTSSTAGSDWDLVRRDLRAAFGARVSFHVPEANPTERSRVNAVNTRLCNALGMRRLLVDPQHAPHVVRDLEGVRTLEGGSGELDKKHTPQLTHISDALGYYVVREFPVSRGGIVSGTLSP